MCFDSVVVELKAVAKLGRNEEAQLINYMKSGTLETGLLMNFAAEHLEYRRYALTQSASSAKSAVKEEEKEDLDGHTYH